jgi:glycosyltransferase involved in cell wall biosynthesis
MRILILTPTALPSVTGNAMSAERWRTALTHAGEDVAVLAAEGLKAESLADEIQRFSPDLIHVHHAVRAGFGLLDPSMGSLCDPIPLVVSPGGTDLYLDAEISERREVFEEVTRRARAVVVQGEGIGNRLRELFPGLRDRVVSIPKSFFWLGHELFDLREAAGCGPEAFLFFLPAGVRPVKGNLECLLALERVHAVRPSARAVFSGPALDGDYAGRFLCAVERRADFARWVPTIPPGCMWAAYEGADVVLNGSFSEGLSNVLLEAAAAGKPVLASDIPGNRWPVLGRKGDPPFGLLFDPRDPASFVDCAVRLMDDEELRRALAASGRERAAGWPGPEAEASALLDVYHRALT